MMDYVLTTQPSAGLTKLNKTMELSQHKGNEDEISNHVQVKLSFLVTGRGGL
jgi:hypothetical protein